jgi:stage III sporulation protein AH
MIVSVRMTGKHIVFAVILLIAGAVVCFWQVEQNLQARIDRTNAMQVSKPVVNEQVVPAASPDFFTEYRLERDKIRSEQSDLLRETIKNAKTEDARQHAQDMMLKLVQEKQQEMEIESLIKSRGFADALVFIKATSVNAVLKTTTLSREEVVQVADIIGRVAGMKAEDITISAKP